MNDSPVDCQSREVTEVKFFAENLARPGGSSPLPATKKDSIVDTISAMEFCFIYGKRPIFALLPLVSAVLRAFFALDTINPSSSAQQGRNGGLCIVQGFNRSENDFA